jgi:hypothetical protein
VNGWLCWLEYLFTKSWIIQAVSLLHTQPSDHAEGYSCAVPWLCGEPFQIGRSMSQHLTQNLWCKALLNSTPNVLDIPPPVCTAGLHAPHPDTDLFVSEPESEPWFDRYGSSPNASENDEQEFHKELAEPGLNDDSNLQNAVRFPVAFINSAFHEVQLLKLLYGIGAPNYDFQSFMEWERNCSSD